MKRCFFVLVPVENSVSNQMPSNGRELKAQTPVLLEAEGYRIQPRQTVAIGGLKRKGTPVAAHFFPDNHGYAVFRLRAGGSGDGGRPLAAQPRFVLDPVASPRVTPGESLASERCVRDS
jgi:hypothetical protein